MSDRETDEDLSHLMRDHFAAELDQYVGKAGERFSRAIAPQDAAASAVAARSAAQSAVASHAKSFGFHAWWAVPVVAAAAVVAMVAAPQFRTVAPESMQKKDSIVVVPPSADGLDGGTQPQPVAFEPQDVQGRVRWATRDEGQVWLDDETPARKIRTRQLQTLQYTDPRDSSRIEITVPRDEIVFVSSPRM